MIKRASIKENADKLHIIEMKSFCSSNDTIKKLKRQTIGQEDRFATGLLDKEFESRPYNKLL